MCVRPALPPWGGEGQGEVGDGTKTNSTIDTSPGALRAPPSPPLRRRGSAASLLVQFRNDPERRIAAGDALHVVEGVAHPRRVALEGRPGQMRGQDDVVEGEQRVVGGRR